MRSAFGKKAQARALRDSERSARWRAKCAKERSGRWVWEPFPPSFSESGQDFGPSRFSSYPLTESSSDFRVCETRTPPLSYNGEPFKGGSTDGPSNFSSSPLADSSSGFRYCGTQALPLGYKGEPLRRDSTGFGGSCFGQSEGYSPFGAELAELDSSSSWAGPEAEVQRAFLYGRVPPWFLSGGKCLLCRKDADPSHLQSGRHRSRVLSWEYSGLSWGYSREWLGEELATRWWYRWW